MNASRSIPLVARRWARAAAIAAAVVGAAGSASAQSIITTDTTINSVATIGQLLVGGSTSPGPTLTINTGANIGITSSGGPAFTVGFARTAPETSGPYAAVVQNGGSVSIPANGQLYLGTNISSFNTAYSPASASYTLNGGSITLGSVGTSGNSNLLLLGRSAGNNTFTQTGGTVTVYRTGSAPAVFGVGSVGQGQNTYTISGGTFEGIGVTSQGYGSSVGGGVGGDGTLTINGSSAVIAIQQHNAVFSTGGGSATVDLNAGTLALNGNVTRGLPGGSTAPGTVNFTLGGGTLRPYDANLIVGVATAANTAAFNITLATGTTSTITGAGWKTGTHTVTMDSPLIGSGNIAFAGGTVSLTAANTYSGTTTVSGGTLSLAAGGSFASSPTISVAAGATLSLTGKTSGFTFGSGQTLGGSGSVALPTSGSGVSLAGFLAPGGGSAGTLAFTNAGTFSIESAITSGTGRLQFGLGPTGASDLVTVASGTLAIGTGLLNFNDFAFTELAGFGQGTYTLFSALSLTGSLGATTTGSIGSFTGTLQQAGNEIQLVVVPEPGTTTLAGLGLAAAAWALRRRAAVR